MFNDPKLSILFVIAEILLGGLVGVGAAAVARRGRIAGATALRAALQGGAGLVLVAMLAGWAQAHSAFHNGTRSAVGAAGEDLRLRNWVAEHEILLGLGASALGGLLAGGRLRAR